MLMGLLWCVPPRHDRIPGKRPPIAGRGVREEGRNAGCPAPGWGRGRRFSTRAGRGSDSPSQGGERGREVRKAEEGCPGAGWRVALPGAADAGPCWSLSCYDLFCFSFLCRKSCDCCSRCRGKQLRAERISGSDVSKFGIYQCTCEGCHRRWFNV